jgi:predicted membrane chloride channel (bestrophin family)
MPIAYATYLLNPNLLNPNDLSLDKVCSAILARVKETMSLALILRFSNGTDA